MGRSQTKGEKHMSQQDSLCPKCGLPSWSGHRCAAILEGEEHMTRDGIRARGEHYPCKPDIFEMTYERVEE
jgi:hypothetical protein